jgi:transcriptional regulator with XRE-family HTH domain
LREARVAAGLTQDELGRQIGSHQISISDYERGLKKPARPRLIELIRILGLDIDPDDSWGAGKKHRARGEWTGVACSIDGCDKPVHARGLCRDHYHSDREARNLAVGRVCAVKGCDRGEFASGFCHRCGERRRRGAPDIKR